MPFPWTSSLGINLNELYKKNREQLIESCGIAIFLFGNKENENVARGVIEEFKLSRENGLICLPIRYIGGAAKNIHDIILQDTNEEEKQAIELANYISDGSVDMSVKNIIKTIKMLNKEDF